MKMKRVYRKCEMCDNQATWTAYYRFPDEVTRWLQYFCKEHIDEATEAANWAGATNAIEEE
jgi:hypothetical protein